MCSKIEANEYKNYILEFIFYKFLSEQVVKFSKVPFLLNDVVLYYAK